MCPSEATFEVNSTIAPWIGKTAKLMGYMVTEAFKVQGIDLTQKQWLVLKYLCCEDGRVQNELANITGRDKGSLARLISTLEKKGLVERRPSPEDRRVKLIYITKQGEVLFKKSCPILQNIHKKMRKGISEQKLSEAIEVLKQIQFNIQQIH